MTEEEYSKFRHEAVHALMALNEACDRTFSTSAWPRWNYDLNERILVFSEDGVAKVVAEIQVVGTTSMESNTWMWGWANNNLSPDVVQSVGAVREFGSAESIPRLTSEILADDEFLGWELTAVTARLLGAKGAYRCPVDDGFLYVVYNEIRFAQAGEFAKIMQDGDRSVIECGTHGTAQSTYMCEHLVVEPGQEWFSEDPSEDNLWPDARCGECNLIYQEQGEWNDSNSGRLPIKLVCHQCYELARAKAVK